MAARDFDYSERLRRILMAARNLDFPQALNESGVALDDPNEAQLVDAIGAASERVLGNPHPRPVPQLLQARNVLTDDHAYYVGMAHAMDENLRDLHRVVRAYHAATPTGEVRMLTLRAFERGLNGRYLEQAVILRGAIDKLLNIEDADERLFRNVTLQFAGVVREVPLADGPRVLELAYHKLPVGHERLHVARTLAWLLMLHGRRIEAYEYFMEASASVTTDLDRVFHYFDQATAAAYAGDEKLARASYNIAVRSAEAIDWEAPTVGEGIFALANGAVIGAKFEPATAQRYLGIVQERVPKLSRRFLSAHGRRPEAIVDETRAFVLDGLGDDMVRTIAARAYDGLDAIGFSWRAGRMARLLYEVTGHDRWMSHAIEHLSFYPGTPLLPESERDAVFLPPQQQRILSLLRDGLSPQEIGEQLAISPATVKVHIKRMHRRLNVRNRSQLLRKTASRRY